MQIEERVAKIEGIVGQMNERLNHIETDLRDLREEMRAEIKDLRGEMRSNFKWTIGLMLTMWVTIILTIIFRG